MASRKSVNSKVELANSAVIRELELVSDKIKMTFHNDHPSSFLNHPCFWFQNGYHTQAKAKGLRGWFIASLLVVCVCICFCICICDYLPDKIHRKALQQDGHGQPVSRSAVACWVWGQQSHCISATTTGEEEEEMINKILSILRILQFFSSFAAATNEQQLAAVVSKSAAAIARQVIFSRFQVLLSSIVICWPGIK